MLIKKLKAKIIKENNNFIIDVYYDHDPQYKRPVFYYHETNSLQLHEDCAIQLQKDLKINDFENIIETFGPIDINPYSWRKQWSYGTDSYDIVVPTMRDTQIMIEKIEKWWRNGIKKLVQPLISDRELICDQTICNEILL